MSQPWSRQVNEPARWYARFETYRLLGPTRTLEEAFRVAVANAGLTDERYGGSSPRPGQAWYNAARKWQWQERAEAWDEVERARLRASEEARRYDAHEKRVGLIARILGTVADLLLLVDLRAMSRDEVLAHLPTLRLLFRDLLQAERLELGLPVTLDGGESGQGEPLLTADDLLAAAQELESFRLALTADYPGKSDEPATG